MTKDKITYQYVFNYKIIAISTHLKDYRVSFYINDLLNLKLKKVDDLVVDNKSEEQAQSFEQQVCSNSETETSYHLIHNKGSGFYFLPSLKKFDFILIIKTENEINNQDEIYETLKASSHFQIIYKVDALSRKENKIIETNILYNL